MKLSPEEINRMRQQAARMELVRSSWEKVWREISDYFLPRRYPWLQGDKDQKSANIRNNFLLSSVSITALRTLATGMMNGITSPTRPWFRLRRAGRRGEQEQYDIQVWLEEASTIMLHLMGTGNFYNSLEALYNEWCGFGTASMGVYEDPVSVFRCYNCAVGEFAISTGPDGRVNRHLRTFSMKTEQLVRQFGLENCSPQVQSQYARKDASLFVDHKVYNLVVPSDEFPAFKDRGPFLDIYWEAARNDGHLLRMTPTEEMPYVTPRWATYAEDEYGTSPCFDAIPDVLQLQQMIKRRGQGLDKMLSPPLVMSASLKSQPKSTVANGITYVAGNDLRNLAAPLYQVNVPLQELNQDIIAVTESIRQVLYNDLFMMISNLSTVRSATEIDARREERLVMLGPVLERFEEEGLGPLINRIFQICLRAGVFPPLPEGLEEAELAIEYIGVLSDAQRALGTVPIERYLQILGNMIQIFPDEVQDVPNAEEIFRGYGEAIGLKAIYQRSRDQVEARRQRRQQAAEQQQMMAEGQALAAGAQQLSDTELGGGTNALQAMLGV